MMLPLIALLWVLVLCFGGVVKVIGAPDWPNKPDGLTTVLDCPFSGSLCPGMFNEYNTQAYAQDPSAPLSPPSVFESYMAAGSTTGNGQWGMIFPYVRELYVGTWWNPGPETMGNTNQTNKLLFGRNNDGGDNSFLGWMGCAGCVKTLKWYNQSTVCNKHVRGVYGSCYADGDGTGWFNPNGPSDGKVAAGSGWHRIEFYLRSSTGPDTRDGVIRWWLDGKLVGDYPGVNYSPNGIRDFQINHTWDGFNTADRDKSKRWSYKWDHLVLATGGGTAPVTPPPPPPAPGAILDLKITVQP